MDNYYHKRKQMVDFQIRSRGIYSQKVLEAMQKIRRDMFVPEDRKELSYDDTPLTIGYGQTISQPYIVALMTEASQLAGKEKVLEIGTGSGYQSAVLSLLCAEVYTLERIKPLALLAEKRLAEAGCHNCRVIYRDGFTGLPEKAPFDVIIVTAAPPVIPVELAKQLSPEGGRMIIPVGSVFQKLICITRNMNSYSNRDISDVVFVPMLPDVADPA